MIKFSYAAAAALLGVIAIGPTSADAQSRGTQAAPETAMTPPVQSFGGPIRQGNFCWTSTDPRGFGYWRTCTSGYESFASAAPPSYQQPQPVPQGLDAYAAAREASSNMLGGGGDSGGGDSGGGGPL